MKANVEVDRVDDDVAHAYVEGHEGMIHLDRDEGGSTWYARDNTTDELYAWARTLPAVARRLGRRFGHTDPTVLVDDERRY